MRYLVAAVCVLFGLVGWGGQALSAFNFRLAQKLGFQEKEEDTDELYRNAELNCSRWDALVLWTMIATGVLMVFRSPAWPYVALFAAGIHLDTAGRESAKTLALRRSGVRTGAEGDRNKALVLFGVMTVIALGLIGAAGYAIATGAR